ncbi:MAG: hypothetical protein IJO93_02485 [Clostridia bacterium]|nr:hypothetical protein [Clostridia bacterium]
MRFFPGFDSPFLVTGVDKFFYSLSSEKVEASTESIVLLCVGLVASVAALIGFIFMVRACARYGRTHFVRLFPILNVLLYTAGFSVIMFSSMFSAWWLWAIMAVTFIIPTILNFVRCKIGYGIMFSIAQAVVGFLLSVLIYSIVTVVYESIILLFVLLPIFLMGGGGTVAVSDSYDEIPRSVRCTGNGKYVDSSGNTYQHVGNGKYIGSSGKTYTIKK